MVTPPITLSASAASPASLEVVVGVSVLTVGLVGILCAKAGATQDVRPKGSRFQMVRSDAESIPAKVVKRHSIGDRADQQLVGKAVGEKILSGDVDVSVISGASRLAPRPHPTGIGDTNFCPKTGRRIGPHAFIIPRWWNYPGTGFLDTEKALLRASPFFR